MHKKIALPLAVVLVLLITLSVGIPVSAAERTYPVSYTHLNTAFSFPDLYHFIKERGYAIYPGKLTDAETFRIGNIGEIYPEDIDKLLNIFREYMKLQEEHA